MTPQDMTPLQQSALAYIDMLLRGDAVLSKDVSWLKPSYVMAHITIESNWRQTVHSTDGFGSIGLMQVLPATAIQMGVKGDMTDPKNSILAGMRYIDNCHTILAHYRQRAGGTLTYDDVCAAYNEGPGNVMRGRQDPHYVTAWAAAQKEWAFVDAMEKTPVTLPDAHPSHLEPPPQTPMPVTAGGWMPRATVADIVERTMSPPDETEPPPVQEPPEREAPPVQEPPQSTAAQPVEQVQPAPQGEPPHDQDGQESAEDLNAAELANLGTQAQPAPQSAEQAAGEGDAANPDSDAAAQALDAAQLAGGQPQ